MKEEGWKFPPIIYIYIYIYLLFNCMPILANNPMRGHDSVMLP